MKYLIVAALFVFAGCDLFSTRTPEPPNSSSTFIWTPATTSDYLIDNFVGTLKVLDASNYMRVFVSATDSTGSGGKTFQYTPAPGLDQTARSVFQTWTPESERSWLAKLQSLLAKNSQLIVTLQNRQTDPTSPTTTTFSADYTISIPVSSSSTVIPSSIQGSLQMQLLLVTTEQGTKEWRVVSWSDFLPKSGTGPTWTDLKVKLAS
jgi:hypothetical protein